MTLFFLFRRFLCSAMLGGIVFLCPAFVAIAQSNTLPDVQPLTIRPGSVADEEELDLNWGDPKPARPSLRTLSQCEPLLPSGAPVSVGVNVLASSSCLLKQWAQTQVSLAYAVHDQLWCTDPGAQKNLFRHYATQRIIMHRALVSQREAWEKADKLRHSQGLAFNGYADLLQPKTLASLNPNPSPPVVPYYDSSQERSLWWDGREAEKCKNWFSFGPQLGPSLSARGLGLITVEGQSCEALLVEVNTTSGRYGSARLSWIAAKCTGFVSPSPVEIALALTGGPQQAQAWQDRHLQAWHWQGFDPRAAKARSAEGF